MPIPIDHAALVAGLATALILLMLARLLLPAESRARTQVAAIYLVLSFVFGVASLVLDSGGLARVLRFLEVFFLLASCGRSIVLLSVDVVFGRKTHRAPPRIFRDLTQAVVYVVVLMLTLRAVGVEPGSLLTTSALLTAVVGLALQDTLGNLVSGLALQMQRPFEVGDWIQFDADAKQIGRVTEVNWRATTLFTSDLVEVIVPNAMLAKAPIRNYTRPSSVSRRSISVQAPYDVSPRKVQEAILVSLADVQGLVPHPSPWVQLRSFADSGVEYWVWYFIDDFEGRERIDGDVRARVWYALQRAGIAIPFPIRTVHMHEVSAGTIERARERELEARDAALRCVDFLSVLPPDSHRALASAATQRLYAPNEVVIAQGDRSSDLFIIERGEAEVTIRREGVTVPVARLGPGKFFGEMGLMTGEARRATVRALSECTLLVVDHNAFQKVLEGAPDVVERMSDLLAARQAELEAVVSERRAQGEKAQDRSKRLISQIKGFFNL